MRYYLDTQTLAQVLFMKVDNMSVEVRKLLEDCANTFCTSVVCVKELIHLIQTERIRPANKKKRYSAAEVVSTISLASIEICHVNTLHLEMLAHLPLYPNHNDPNDRLIIAQAIRDRIPLISSDTKFDQYRAQGLDLVFNEK